MLTAADLKNAWRHEGIRLVGVKLGKRSASWLQFWRWSRVGCATCSPGSRRSIPKRFYKSCRSCDLASWQRRRDAYRNFFRSHRALRSVSGAHWLPGRPGLSSPTARRLCPIPRRLMISMVMRPAMPHYRSSDVAPPTCPRRQPRGAAGERMRYSSCQPPWRVLTM